MRMPLSSLFDEDRYLAQYPWVREAIQTGRMSSAEYHWWHVGRYENCTPMYTARSNSGQALIVIVVVRAGTELKQLCRTIESLVRQTLTCTVYFVVEHDLAAEPLSYLFERAARDSHFVLIGCPATLWTQGFATALSCARSEFVAYMECGTLLLAGSLDELVQPLRSNADTQSSSAAWIWEQHEEEVLYPEELSPCMDDEGSLPPLFAMRTSILASISWAQYPNLTAAQLYRVATASRRKEIIKKPLAMRSAADVASPNLSCISWFDEIRYRADNPDVEAGIISGYVRSAEDHWWRYGRAEARMPRFVETLRSSDRPLLTLLSTVVPGEDMRSAIERTLKVDIPGTHLTLVDDGLSNEAALELWLICADNPRVQLVSRLGCGNDTLNQALRRWIHGRWIVSVPYGIELDPESLRELCRRCERASSADVIPVAFSASGRTLLTRATRSDSCEDPCTVNWRDLAHDYELDLHEADTFINLGVVSGEIEGRRGPVSRPTRSNTRLPQAWSPLWNEFPIFEPVEVLDFLVSPETSLVEHSTGFVAFVFVVRTRANEILTARMRLHLSEPFEGLIFADPRAFLDGGYTVNSVGSSLFNRRTNYTGGSPFESLFASRPQGNLRFFRIREEDVQKALSAHYTPETETPRAREQFRKNPAVAFTMLHPNYAGGGTAIALRFCDWLSELGVDVTVYSLTPVLSKLRPRVKSVVINSRQDLASQITEPVIVAFSAFHIEPLLRYRVGDKIIIQLRQAIEAAHYDLNLEAIFQDKPFIRLSERAPVIPINVAPHLQEYYARLSGQHGELIVNGIDTSVFYRRPHREHLNPEFTIFSTGAPHYWLKGQQFLSAAVNGFARSRPEQPVRWIIASGAKDAMDLSSLRQSSNVTIEYLPGLMATEVANFMRLSDVTVSPSLYEGFGLPTIEALACGVPVIAAHSYGLDYILEHESNCIVVPPGSAEELQSALERIYTDGDLRRRLSEEGPRTASSFGLLPQFSQFTDAFERILDHRFDPRAVEEMKARFSDRSKLPTRIRNKKTDPNNPLVSVVVPAFNRASLLGDTLDSVRAQTCSDWELLVVDDGSSDDTVRIAREYARRDDRIRVVCHNRNQGIAAALNTGIAESRGKFFCWLSPDDLFHHDKLRIQLEEFSRLPSNYGMVYSSFDQRLEETRRFKRLSQHQAVEDDFEFSHFLKFDCIQGCTAMIPLSVVREVGGFSPSFRFAQDAEMWMRITAAGYRLHYTPHSLMLKRVHALPSSIHNIIQCRFDQLITLRFYLSHFSFLEIFRSIDVYQKSERSRLVSHIVSQFDHEEALIYHEVLSSAFLEWLHVGLGMTPTEIHNDILCGIRDGLKNLGARVLQASTFIEKLTEIIETPRREERTILDLRLGRRSPLHTEDALVQATRDLFKWACKILLDKRASRLGGFQGFFAKIAKESETHHWVANSALSYLAGWPGGDFEFLRPYSGTDAVPKNDTEAEELFVKIVVPSVAAELATMRHSADKPWSNEELDRAAQHSTPTERATALEMMSHVALSTRMQKFYRALRAREVSCLVRGSSSFIPV